jgi:hypothetical protein
MGIVGFVSTLNDVSDTEYQTTLLQNTIQSTFSILKHKIASLYSDKDVRYQNMTKRQRKCQKCMDRFVSYLSTGKMTLLSKHIFTVETWLSRLRDMLYMYFTIHSDTVRDFETNLDLIFDWFDELRSRRVGTLTRSSE